MARREYGIYSSEAELPTLVGHSGPVAQAFLSADKHRILTASSDGTARIWNAETGDELLRLTGHKGRANPGSLERGMKAAF